MKTKNLHNLAIAAMKEAIKELREKAKKENKPLAIWKNNRVVWEIPDEFED